jgi:hypothetical protein
MRKLWGQMRDDEGNDNEAARELPSPTRKFRRRSWEHFQRALDPLAPPRPLPTRRRY